MKKRVAKVTHEESFAHKIVEFMLLKKKKKR